jgi:hypothetical protein
MIISEILQAKTVLELLITDELPKTRPQAGIPRTTLFSRFYHLAFLYGNLIATFTVSSTCVEKKYRAACGTSRP